jgi:hypothetical protein
MGWLVDAPSSRGEVSVSRPGHSLRSTFSPTLDIVDFELESILTNEDGLNDEVSV